MNAQRAERSSGLTIVSLLTSGHILGTFYLQPAIPSFLIIYFEILARDHIVVLSALITSPTGLTITST